MRLIKKLQDQVYASASDTGDNLKLSQVPAEVGGRVNYVRRIKLYMAAALTLTASGSTAMAAVVNPTRLIQQVYLILPDIGLLVNQSGNMATRLYRLRNGGNYPPYSAGTVGGTATAPSGTAPTTIYDGITYASTNTVGQTITQTLGIFWIIDFFDPEARDPEDFVVPAALLANAQFKVSWNATSAIVESSTGVASTTVTGSLITTVESVAKDELQLPKITTLDTVPFTGIEPNLDAVPGLITHYGIAPTSEGKFTQSDANTVGLSFGGTFVISEDILPVSQLYAAFNCDSQTDLEDHSAGTPTSRSSVIPGIFPPSGKVGQHLTYEVVPPGLKPRIRLDADAAGLTIVRRYAWANGPWLSKVRTALGIPANAMAKLKTASGKAAKRGDAGVLPVKVKRA